VSVARIHVGSGPAAAGSRGPVVDRTQTIGTGFFYKSSAFTVVVELDRYTPEFPLNALKVVSGGKVGLCTSAESSLPRALESAWFQPSSL
jgi:hypothetical protein